MAYVEAGTSNGVVTEQNFGDLFLLAYADYLRSYDHMRTQVDSLEATASRLGVEAVSAFTTDPSSIEALPDLTDEAEAVLHPIHQAVLLRELAHDLTKKFEDQPYSGFYNPDTETLVELPVRKYISVTRLPNKHAFITSATGSSSRESVSGVLHYAGLEAQPLVRSRSVPIIGHLTVYRPKWRKFYEDLRIDGLIDRRDYTAQVELSFHPSTNT